MLLIVGRTASAIAAGRASYRGWWCLPLLWEGRPGAMLLICWADCVRHRRGARLLQGDAVSAAFVGGSPRRDAFACGADVVRHRRGARLLQGMRCLLILWEGPGGVPCPGAMLLLVGRTLSAIAAGRASYRGMRCLLLLWEGRPGAMPFDGSHAPRGNPTQDALRPLC